MPAHWAVGQAILDYEPYRQIDHAVGIVTARWREIREVGVEVVVLHR
jgi:hypothetical protein